MVSGQILGSQFSDAESGIPDIGDKTRHHSSSLAMHSPDTNTNIVWTLCLPEIILASLGVFNISSQVQTSFYQNQFELGVIIHVFQTGSRERRGGGTDC